MYIRIHRGTQQIGGNLIETGASGTRLLFDAGANLSPLDSPVIEDSFELEGLTKGAPDFNAVFISHHHNDHCGLLKKLLKGIPVYAGKETKHVLDVLSDFTNQPKPGITNCIEDSVAIEINGITITPITVTHSARDAYMFLIQADGKNVLYTGDFCKADGVPEKVTRLIGAYGKLDVLISEGTNIRREPQKGNSKFRGEEWVTRKAAGRMRLYPGTVFVLCSSTNEDRIESITKAADWAGRMVCEDLFQSVVRGKASVNTQRFIANRVSEEKTPRIWPYFDKLYQNRALVGAESLAKMPGRKVIFIRTSMTAFLERYINAKNEAGCLLIYSMWKGYRQTRDVKNLLDFFRANGIDTISVHCSGHAYRETVEALIDELAPEALLPIHCDSEDRKEFLTLHKNCLMLNDSERYDI